MCGFLKLVEDAAGKAVGFDKITLIVEYKAQW